MPFDINYGPISTAMGLARQAGQAQGTQLGFQDQQEMQRQLLAQQQASQQARAQDISLSLEGQRNAATQNLAQAQLANTAAYQHANLAQLGAYRQQVGGARVEQAGAASQRAQDTGQYQQQEVAAKQQQLQQQAAYQSWEQSHGDMIARNGEAQSLAALIHAKLNAGQDATADIAHIQTLFAKQDMVSRAQQQPPANLGTAGEQGGWTGNTLNMSGTQAGPALSSQPGQQVQPGSRGNITSPQNQAFIQQFMQQAGGDWQKASQLAIAAGFTW